MFFRYICREAKTRLVSSVKRASGKEREKGEERSVGRERKRGIGARSEFERGLAAKRQRSAQQNPLLGELARGHRTIRPSDALPAIRRLQGGPSRARSSRHRFRRVRERGSGHCCQGRSSRLQDLAYQSHQDFLCQKIINSFVIT